MQGELWFVWHIAVLDCCEQNGEEQLKEADRRVTTDVFDDDADVRILDRYQVNWFH